MEQAEIRAAIVRGNLDALEVLGNANLHRVREEVGVDVLREVEGALRMSFVPTRLDRDLLQAVCVVAGADGVDKVVQASITRAFDAPLFRPFVDGARSVFGMTPIGVLRVACRGYGAMHRHNGDFIMGEHGEGHAVVRFEGGADDVRADSNYLEAYRAVLRAVLSLACTRHSIDILVEGPRVLFRCQW